MPLVGLRRHTDTEPTSIVNMRLLFVLLLHLFAVVTKAGDIENGGSCKVDWDCVSNWCLNKVCTNPVGVPCEGAGTCPGEASKIIYCSEESKTCQRYILFGDRCTAKDRCISGLCCLSGKCKNCSGQQYSECTSDRDCNPGLACFKHFFSQRKQCRYPDGTINSPCSKELPCKGNLECAGGKCNGCDNPAICVSNSNCCKGYKCSRTGSLGGDCVPAS